MVSVGFAVAEVGNNRRTGNEQIGVVMAAEIAIDHTRDRVLAHAKRPDNVPCPLCRRAVMDLRDAKAREDFLMVLSCRGEARLGVRIDAEMDARKRNPIHIPFCRIEAHPVLGLRQLFDEGSKPDVAGRLLAQDIVQLLAAQALLREFSRG